MSRLNGRKANELRPLEFELNYTKWAEGSVLVKSGDTHVLCTASVDDRVPRWLHQSKEAHGWLTAEYGMLPRSTFVRMTREKQWPRGRTQEIARLIGRSLRMALDLEKLGQRQILVDCDVIQADGGTRTAAITGSWLAVNLALQSLVASGKLLRSPIKHQVAAVSVGIVKGVPLLDLDYAEDSSAETDMNVVMSDGGKLIEVQSTGEQRPFSRDEFDKLLDLAEMGIKDILALQAFALMQA